LSHSGNNVTCTADIINRVNKADNENTVVVSGSSLALEQSDQSTFRSALKATRSYIGSTAGWNGWQNVLSCRHRNGASDGNAYGMYIRTHLTATSDNLYWDREHNGTWQGERTIIDSGNISSQSVNYATSSGSVSGYSMLSNWQGDVNSFQNTSGLLAGKLYGCSNAPLSYYSFLHAGDSGYYMQFNARSNVLYFRSSGEDGYTPSWTEVITSKNIGSQDVNSSTYASSYLANRQSIGSSSQNHAQALQSYFDSYKSSIPRNCLTANYSSSYENGSLYFGYFLNGYF